MIRPAEITDKRRTSNVRQIGRPLMLSDVDTIDTIDAEVVKDLDDVREGLERIEEIQKWKLQ